MTTLIKKIENFIDKRPNWSAAIVLGLLVLIFISPSFFQGRFLAPVDTTHYVAPYLDITTQMLPWWKLSSELIKAGHFPFWNVFSGNGLPLMANMQSAIFFPMSWLFYIFPIRFALAAYAFLKLLLMGLFTYFYLREMKLKYSSCLLGAILFTFCNSNVIWFLWPLTSVILILPLSFFIIERYFNTRDIKTAFWLAPVTALGLFAGHPQTFFYIFCAIYGYAIFRSFVFVGKGLDPSLQGTHSIISLKQRFKHLLILSSVFLLGFIMSAVAVLPFLEYLKLSANLNYRAGFAENPFYLQPIMFLANLIPDFYGNTGVKNFSYLLVPNYGELALGYIGVSGFVLAIFSFTKKAKKQIWFFVIAALLCAALVYHAPIIYWLVNKLPGFNLNYNNRLLYLWAFCASVLAAFGLENILDGKITRKRANWTFAGFAIFSVLLIIANRLATHGWQFAHNLDWHTVSLWQDAMIVAFFANLIICYFVIQKIVCHCEAVAPTEAIFSGNRIASSPAKAPAPRNDTERSTIFNTGLPALFILVVLETAIHGMIFTKTSKPTNFYPSEPALVFLSKQYQIDQARVFTYGDNLLPNIGTWYHINELNDHDTIYLTSNKQLKTNVANYNYSPEYTFDEPNLNALRFLSVKYLLYPSKEGSAMLKKYPRDLSLAFSDSNYTVLSLNDSFPRAFLLNAGSPDDLNAQLADLIKNPKSHPVTLVGDFKIGQDGTEKIAYNMTGDNYLVTTDNYYPDWTANFSSGAAEKAQNAFGLRAVVLSPGANSVTISYHSKSFQLGLEATIGALLIWGALIKLI